VVEVAVPADPLYQHLLLTAEKKFWRCIEIGEPPRLFGVEGPRARIEAVRVVDMSTSNSWAEFAGIVLRTHTGQSEAIHSPEAWARTVVKFTVPVEPSIAVVCTVAICCRPSDLRRLADCEAPGWVPR
jgi:hypothetical protein